jgi:ABC-type transporter Mla subunit MlaD
MANSKTMAARMAQVERDSQEFKRAIAQLTNVLVDQSERIDRLGDRLSDKIDGLGGKIDGLGDKIDGLGSRLDRLIAATIQERTYSFDRLADIERRLTRLEERDPR